MIQQDTLQHVSDSLRAVSDYLDSVKYNYQNVINHVDQLEKSQDKILTAFYTLVGIFIGLVSAAQIWNLYRQRRIEKEALQKAMEEIKKETQESINKLLPEDIKSSLKSINRSIDRIKIWNIKSDIDYNHKLVSSRYLFKKSATSSIIVTFKSLLTKMIALSELSMSGVNMAIKELMNTMILYFLNLNDQPDGIKRFISPYETKIVHEQKEESDEEYIESIKDLLEILESNPIFMIDKQEYNNLIKNIKKYLNSVA